MSNPFNWLRLVRLALALLVLVVSVGIGIPFGPGQGQADPLAVLSRLTGVVADLAGSAGSANSKGDGALGEIVDEPIGAVGQQGAVAPETPTGSDAAGGVLGGGEAIGPDGGAVAAEPTVIAPEPAEPPAPMRPTEDAAPTATVPPSLSPSAAPKPSQTPRLTATEALRPSPTPGPTITPPPTSGPGEIRLDEPVLRFLPEITAAANATGIPASLLAGVVRVESNGDPNLMANGTRIGLSGVSEAELANHGLAHSAWHDPAANLRAGAGVLARLYGGSGSWDAALEAYFGVDCDATGVCAGEYRYAIQAWSRYYAGPVSNPGGSGFNILPPVWAAPALAPYQGSNPRPIPLPPGIAAPTPTPQPSAPPTATPEISGASVETPAMVPTETPVPPTEPPTATLAPTSTAVPTSDL